MNEIEKPLLIQIDDEVREMTDEEVATYREFCLNAFRVTEVPE